MQEPAQVNPVTSASRVALIVDDDALVRWSLKQALQPTYTGLEANSLELARAWLGVHGAALGLITLDLQLPDGDGRDFLRECASAIPSCPVLVITALLEPELERQLRQAGAYAVLGKPFEMVHFRSVVSSLDRWSREVC